MTSIEINKSFDELKDENKRLENELNFANKCLKILFQIKNNLNRVLDKRSDSLVISLTSEDIHIFNDLEEEYKRVFEENNSTKESESTKTSIEDQFNSDLIQSSEVIPNRKQFVSKQSSIDININQKTDKSSDQQMDSELSASQQKITYILPNTEKAVLPRRTTRSSKAKTNSKESESEEYVLIFKSGPKYEVRTENNQRFKCNVHNCDKGFVSRQQLVYHQKECHKNHFPFKCTHEGCDSTFRLESKLLRHIDAIHYKKLLKCRVKDCDNEFETTTSLMTHLKECHKDLFPFHCVLESCESIFRKKTELIRHLLEVHKKRIKCPISGCNYETDQRIELRVHQQKCHNKSCLKQFKCRHKGCESSFRNNSRLQRHIVEVHQNERRYTCAEPQCGKSFKTGNALKAHLIIHSDETPFKCEFKGCNHWSKSVHRLKLHQKIHSNDRPFICEFEGCAERFKTKLTLQAHSNTHSDELPIRCPVEECLKYIKPHLMRAHVYSHSQMELSCDWPGCQFVTKGNNKLRSHQKLTHCQERNFGCDWGECGKRFKTQHQLNYHYKIHTNDKPYVCQWPGCEYRSAYSANVTIHSRTHRNEKPFGCQWPGCDYRSSISGNLKKHMKIHEKS